MGKGRRLRQARKRADVLDKRALSDLRHQLQRRRAPDSTHRRGVMVTVGALAVLALALFGFGMGVRLVAQLLGAS